MEKEREKDRFEERMGDYRGKGEWEAKEGREKSKSEREKSEVKRVREE